MESPSVQDPLCHTATQENSSAVDQLQENVAATIITDTNTKVKASADSTTSQQHFHQHDNEIPGIGENDNSSQDLRLRDSNKLDDTLNNINKSEVNIIIQDEIHAMENSQINERLFPTISKDIDEQSDVTMKHTTSEFGLINSEIKTIGVEISDEEAKQLKNDIRRLSPIHVSLHERTLGEISLTSDSGLFDDQITLPHNDHSSTHNTTNCDVDCDSKSEVNSVKIKCALNASVNNHDRIESEQLEMCKTNSRKELLIVLSRVHVTNNDPSRTNNFSDISSIDNVSDECINNKNSATENKLVQLSDTALITPKYLENDQLTRKSPMVVLERAEDIKQKNIERNDVSIVKTLETIFNENADNSVDDTKNIDTPTVLLEAESASVTDIAESVDTETETETGSDSSELVSITSVHVRDDCAEPVTNVVNTCPEGDILTCDEITPGLLTRLETERPEAFTEDSAESLALATGTRDEVRSDGSDSGLGSEIPGDPGPPPVTESDSETSFLDRIPDDILSDKEKVVNALDNLVPGASDSGASLVLPLPSFSTPQKSSLKRRLSDCMEGEPSAKRTNSGDEPARKKRSIHFDAVTVYYFPRAQGFTCVPSQGGSTLGMSATHTHAERFSLSEHAAEQRRMHRARLAQLRSERVADSIAEAASSSEDPSDDTDEEPSDIEDLDIDSYYFLQPVPTWQRRALLRAAGVRRIDAVEKDDCRDIRASREHCGCGCKGYCDPESCPCSRANVKCQVDRAGFPCGCSRDGCANSSGRIEFNPVRVRTHFIHTLMRLELEKKQRDEETVEQEMSTNRVVDCTSVTDPSCINGGGFTTLHYDNHNAASTTCQPIHNAREDSLDLYAIRDECYPNGDTVVDNSHNSTRKIHPEFNQAFQSFSGQQSTFQPTGYQDYQTYEPLPSTSRSQFQQQFQSVSSTAGFSHYSHYQDPNAIQQIPCHPGQHQQQPTIYETTFAQDESNGSQQYINLNSVQPMNNVVQQLGKLEPFSELLAGRYSYYGEVEPQPINNYHSSAIKIEEKVSVNETNNVVATSTDECDENFGEIIKKSMVETVSA
ncbi:hypothetical protein PV325_001713 [Microctonus aethiopoides]|nr:hypothetical protein PV325_001713 [Microctonus aethiopoides]